MNLAVCVLVLCCVCVCVCVCVVLGACGRMRVHVVASRTLCVSLCPNKKRCKASKPARLCKQRAHCYDLFHAAIRHVQIKHVHTIGYKECTIAQGKYSHVQPLPPGSTPPMCGRLSRWLRDYA